VNFHVGVGLVEERRTPIWTGFDQRAAMILRSTMLFTENIGGIANLLFSGILQRFPKLNFVSVESGIGYVPYLLEACDWQYEAGRVWEGNPAFDMRPSDYFRRQVYVTYWFEKLAPRIALDWIGADRVMLETDFPHPTSLAHAAGQRKQPLRDLIDEATVFLTPENREKVMWQNAARLYNIPVPA
jgi:predicted TIM-barrel fold metal-dependent hydrolase